MKGAEYRQYQVRDHGHRHFLKIRDGWTCLCAGTSGLGGGALVRGRQRKAEKG